jgi:hypothetical protein
VVSGRARPACWPRKPGLVLFLMPGPERSRLVAVTTVHRHVSDRVRWYETRCKQMVYVIILTGLTRTVVTEGGGSL